MQSILIFVDEMYEDLELWYPKIRMEEAGFKTVVAGPQEHVIFKGKHGYPCKSDISFEMVNPKEFRALIIPGGFAPDKIRRDKMALKIIHEMDKEKKPIAFICHGGWVLISAKILDGKKATGSMAIQDDLENAGAIFSDAAVVVDGNLISSRKPEDLPQFCKAIIRNCLEIN